LRQRLLTLFIAAELEAYHRAIQSKKLIFAKDFWRQPSKDLRRIVLNKIVFILNELRFNLIIKMIKELQ